MWVSPLGESPGPLTPNLETRCTTAGKAPGLLSSQPSNCKNEQKEQNGPFLCYKYNVIKSTSHTDLNISHVDYFI